MALVKVNAMSYALLIKYMLEGIYNCKELAELTGLHYVTVLQYTRELRKAGAAHISMWEKDARGRDMVKVYKLGEGRDARRSRLTAAQRQARTRNKQRALQMQQMLMGARDVETA